MQQTIENKMQQLIKKQKSMRVDYECLKIMHQTVIKKDKAIHSQLFEKIFNTVGQQIKHLLLFEDLNYRIWLNDASPANLRQKTRFFVIVFDWIVKFEMRVGKLNSYKAQFQLIIDFFKEQTKTIFERMILLQQVHEDLKQLIPTLYDEDSLIISEDKPPQLVGQPLSIQQALTIMTFLKQVITYGVVMNDQTEDLYIDIIRQQVGQLKNCTDFLSKCIYLLLSSCETFDNNLQTELTRVVLIFLHRELPASTTISFIKALMIKTSKPIRFALLLEYIQFYNCIELMNNQIVLEQLENIIHFRQLIIGQKDVKETETIKQPLCSLQKQLFIKARTKQRIYFSRESQQENLLKFQIYIELGDITVRIFFYDQKEQILYWQQQKSSSKRVELLLKHKGLYSLEFDNTYSWINGKKITYKMDQFVKVFQDKLDQ